MFIIVYTESVQMKSKLPLPKMNIKKMSDGQHEYKSVLEYKWNSQSLLMVMFVYSI